MTAQELWNRLGQAVTMESDDAAIRIRASYQPQAGGGTKVFPATYLPDGDTKYLVEQRWDEHGEPVETVMIDSVQSQANRCETALLRVADEVGFPQLLVETEADGQRITISSLEAPHRSRDAYFLDAEDANGTPFDQTDIGKALNAVRHDDATAALQYAPADLVFGVWDSHRGKRVAIRFARSYSSEIIGEGVLEGKRAATKGDKYNLPGTTQVDAKEWRPDAVTGKKKSNVDLNELGHGMIPGSARDRSGMPTPGGVSVKRIERRAVLSLTGLARLQFGSHNAELEKSGRVAVAALALLGDRLAFSGAGIHLRSGADLVLDDEYLEWVGPRGHSEPLELDRTTAVELMKFAASKLSNAGITWQDEPVRLKPSNRLQKIIEQTFTVPQLEAED